MIPRGLLAWGGFSIAVLLLLGLDLGILHRKNRQLSLTQSLVYSIVWIALAFAFNVGVYFWHGPEKALQFLTSYTVELSLSIDNLFVFLLIFGYFGTPGQYRHKVLFWGIIGALVMRGLFIIVGVNLIERFHWMIYIFGALLVISGIKMTFHKNQGSDFDNNVVLRLSRRIIRFTSDYEGGRFLVTRGGRIYASPLFLVLMLLESTDLVFAVDSVPAVLAISSDPFIVFTSNVFAILGLRSMFFALEGILKRFQYLQLGLSVVLILIGTKMLITDLYRIPTWASLLIIGTILCSSLIVSLVVKPKIDTVRGVAGS